jgi:hypothetical protein
MADYKLTTGGVIYQGRTIPESEGNRDWIDYQSWVGLGNTPDPADEPTPVEVAREAAINAAPGAVRQWFADNPNARLIWSMTVAEIVTEIASLVDVSFAGLSAANRTRWKLFLTGITLALRVLVKRERLD